MSERRVILPHALLEVQSLCLGHALILQLEQRLASLAFDNAAAPWHVEWATGADADPGSGATPARPFCPHIYNNDEFRADIRLFLTTARSHVRRFGFCAYYYLKPAPLARWWIEYLQADASRRRALGLPMGMVRPDQAVFSLEPPTKSGDAAFLGPLKAEMCARFVANAEDAERLYEVGFFIDNAQFMATPTAMWQNSRAACASVAPALQAVMRAGHEASHANSVVPSSEFYDLIDLQRQLTEVRTNHLNAEAQAVQTAVVWQVQPADLRDTSMEQAPESRLFQTSTILEERLAQLSEIQTYTMAEAQERLDRIRGQVSGAGGSGGGDADHIAAARRLQYGRPSPMEEAVSLPPSARLAHFSRPTTVFDLAALEHQFRVAIAAAMKVPLSVVEGAADPGRSGGSTTTAHFFNGQTAETSQERSLAATTVHERAFYTAFFGSVYQSVFGPLDVAEIERAHLWLQQREADLAERAGATLRPNQLALEMAGESAAQETESPQQQQQHARASVRVLRRTLHQLERVPGARARLVFQSDDSLNQLTGLLALYDRGLIAPQALQRPVHALYGSHIKIVTPAPAPAPAPTPTAAPAAAPAAAAPARDDDTKRKRKRKPSKEKETSDDDDDEDSKDAAAPRKKRRRGKSD